MKVGDKLTVYERIKERRKELNLSADDVAKALNVSRATIYRYESSDIEKLPITVIEPLSKILRIPPGQLMGWETFERDIQKDQIFDNFLKSIEYKITVEKDGQSESGYYEDNKDDEGNIVGNPTLIPDKEYFSVVISKDNLTVKFTDEDFKIFKDTIEKSIEFELFKQNQKTKK